VASDPRWIHDLAQLYADWQNDLDALGAQRYLRPRSPEEQQQFIQQQQQQAERASQIHDIALRFAENAGASPEELAILLREIRTVSPHKDLTQIIQATQGAMDQAQRSAELVGSNGSAG